MVNRYEGQVWYLTATQFTFEVVLAMMFLFIWAGLAGLIFLGFLWLAAMW